VRGFQHAGLPVTAQVGHVTGSRFGGSLLAAGSAGTGPGRTPRRRAGWPSLRCAAGHSFTITVLIALPVAYLAVFELAEDYVGGDLGLLLLFVVPLLLLPFALGARNWAAHGREALAWSGRAAVRYIVRYLAPMALLGAVPGLFGNDRLGSADRPISPLGQYALTALMAALIIGVPALVALLVVAPWAAVRSPRACRVGPAHEPPAGLLAPPRRLPRSVRHRRAHRLRLAGRTRGRGGLGGGRTASGVEVALPAVLGEEGEPVGGEGAAVADRGVAFDVADGAHAGDDGGDVR